MSLTQKAKMKFLSSLSKRKKKKTREPNFEKPLSGYAVESSDRLMNSSVSVPAKLDQSQAMVTSVASFMSELCVVGDADSSKLQKSEHSDLQSGNYAAPQRLIELVQQSTSANRSNNEKDTDLDNLNYSFGSIDSFDVSSFPRGSKEISLKNQELHENPHEFASLPLSRTNRDHIRFKRSESCDPDRQNCGSLRWNFINAEGTTKIGKQCSSENVSKSSECESFDADDVIEELNKISDIQFHNYQNNCFLENSRISDSKFRKRKSLSRNSLNGAFLTETCDINESTNVINESSGECLNVVSNSIPIQEHLPTDNSVLRKIKFFESHNQSKNVSNAIYGQNISSLKNRLYRTKRGAKPWSSSECISEILEETSSETRWDVTPEASLRVAKGANSGRHGEKLSNFRKSDSFFQVPDTRNYNCGDGNTSCMAGDALLTNSNKAIPAPAFTERNDFRLLNLAQGDKAQECTEEYKTTPLMLSPLNDIDTGHNTDPGYCIVGTREIRKDLTSKLAHHLSARTEDTNSEGLQKEVKREISNGNSNKCAQQQRSKLPQRELRKKLMHLLSLKKRDEYDLEAALNGTSDSDQLDLSIFSSMESNTDDPSNIKSRLPGVESFPEPYNNPKLLRQDSIQSPFENIPYDALSQFSRSSIGGRSTISGKEAYIVVQLGEIDAGEEDLEEVPVVYNTSLREALEPVLARRNLDLDSVNIYLENSKTPLPLNSGTAFLGGRRLQIKEKDKDVEAAKSRQKTSGSVKGNKTIGRQARTDSMSLLLEPPQQPAKQRRGSLQLPFRDHFFGKGDSKTSDPIKVYDDSFGSMRSKILNFPGDESIFTNSPIGSISDSKRGKAPKISVVGLFGPTSKEKERQENLTEILSRYSTHGLPPLPELLAFGRPKFEESLFDLESSWRSVVRDQQNVTRTPEHQEAVWELLKTEVSYIKQVRVIIDVFQSCLINVQQESFLNEIETERLFSNIEKVYECNCLFWQQYLLPILQHSRDSGQPLDPLLSKEGFVEHFSKHFQVYFKYFIENKACLDYAKFCMESSELFKIFIQWAESQKQCNRLKMADMLAHPMQRLLRYSLLLNKILEYTDTVEDRADLQEMIDAVDRLCREANISKGRREEYDRLEAVSKTIGPFDPIEAPNDECLKIIQEYTGNFSLLAPIPGHQEDPRSFLLLTSFKMREGQNIKLDVECLLFTDLLLICKSNKKTERSHIIRPPMRLDQLIVRELKDRGSFLLIYVNEYQVPVSAFTFQADTGTVRGFLDKLREAQRNLIARGMRANIRTQSFRSQDFGDFEDGPTSSSYLNPGSFSLHRTESMESADRYMPNLNDLSADPEQTSLSPALSYSTQRRPSGASLQRELIHASTDTKLFKNCSPLNKHKQNNSDIGDHRLHDTLKQSQSATNITVDNFNTFAQNSMENNTAHDFSSFHKDIDEVDGPRFVDKATNISRPLPQQSTTEPNFLNDEDDFNKQKLNSRRVCRTEKRYHTADEIQTIKNSGKDASIHKRLSWRTDVQLSDPNRFSSKATSADSLRSCPSSSGVSSSGSVHQLFTDISEEKKTDSFDDNVFCDQSLHGSEHKKLFSVGDSTDINDEVDFQISRSSFVESRHSKSKSTSDLVTLLSTSVQISQMQDGIASVAMPADAFSMRLTHSEILKFKKLKEQILHDSSAESSEV